MKIEINRELLKSLFKRFRWILLLVVLIVVFIILWITGHNQNKNKSEKNGSVPPKVYIGDVYDSSLQNCPSDLSGFLTHEVFDLADVDQVNPLGMLSPGGHTIPTDHMNLAHIGVKRIAIYSPGNLTLIFMDDKITYDSETNIKLHDDYSIELALCKGVTIWLNHFSELEPKILSAYENASKRCDSEKYHFGSDNSTYYSPCQTGLNITLSAGELIGHVGTFVGGTVTLATGIDLGAYNFNTPPHAFANQNRYEEGNLHSFCAIDLFTKEIKDKYYSKLGDLLINGSSVVMVPRVGEPLCGTNMQDVPGTLAGNWFVGPGKEGGPTRVQYLMSLAHTLANANIGEISLQGQPELGGNTQIKFKPNHLGRINREFSEVKPDNQIYCYQGDDSLDPNKIDKNGKPIVDDDPFKYLIQLVDTTHLKIEKQLGVCSSTQKEIFANPFIYER